MASICSYCLSSVLVCLRRHSQGVQVHQGEKFWGLNLGGQVVSAPSEGESAPLGGQLAFLLGREGCGWLIKGERIFCILRTVTKKQQ